MGETVHSPKKPALVTGGSRALGRALCRHLAAAGAPVAFTYTRDEPGVAATLQVIQAAGAEGRAFRVSVLDAAAPTAMVRELEEAWGRVVDVNLLGPILCARAVLPVMLEQKAGVIVNVGSVAAERPFRGQAVYAATKGGLESFTRALAAEYGRKGIRAHCVRPGPIETRMLEPSRALGEDEMLTRTPLRRLGRPDEVAELALYLLGDKAAFMTGSVHTIDGGYLQG